MFSGVYQSNLFIMKKNIKTYAMLLLIVTFITLPAITYSQTTNALIERAKSLIDKNEMDTALADLNLIISREPDNAEALTQRSRIFINRNLPDKALPDAEKALSFNANNAVALNVRGLCKGAKKDFSGAIADFSRAITLDPKFTKALMNRGRFHRLQNNPAKALADFSKVIEIEPENYVVLYYRANLYKEQKKFNEAILDYDALIKLDPQIDVYFSERAFSYSQMIGKVENALADAEKAIILNSQNLTALIVRGWGRTVKNDFEKAEADFAAAFALAPADEFLVNIFTNYFLKSHPNPMSLAVVRQRLSAYKREVEQSNQNYETYSKLDNFFSTIKQYSEGESYFLSLAKANEKNVCAYYFAAYGDSYDRKKEYFDKAIYNYDGRNGAVCSAEAAFWAGRHFAEISQGRTVNESEALRFYNLALKRFPNLPFVAQHKARLSIKDSDLKSGGDEDLVREYERKSEVSRLYLQYYNDIVARSEKVNQYARKREDLFDTTAETRAALLVLIKQELTAINEIANKALSEIGDEITPDQKKYFLRIQSTSKAKLEEFNKL